MIRRARAAGLLLLLAGAVYVGIAVPARQDRDEVRRGCDRAREERERLRDRVADLERQGDASGRAGPSSSAAAVRALRRSLLRATAGLPVEAVQISVAAGERGAFGTRGRLAAEGRLGDVLRLTTRLTSPSSGLLVERVGLAEAQGRVRVEVEGLGLEEGS
jgi:hypothetical protein